MNDRSPDSQTAPTFAGTLATIRDHVPGALVPDTAWARLDTVARRLPGPLVGRFYLECRLAAGDPRTDLILGVEDPGRALLAGANPVLGMPRDLMKETLWEALATLCRASRGADRALGERIRRFWIELDLDGEGRDPLAAPRFFVDWQRDDPFGTGQGLAELVDRYPALAGGVLDPAIRRRLERAVAALPASAVLFSVGFHPRTWPATRVRLCVHDRLDRLGRWLASFDDSAVNGTWARLCEVLGGEGQALAERWLIHVDLASSTTIGLGIEVGLRRCRRPDLERHPVLARLVAEGLASGAKHRALGRWPGTAIDTLPHEVWRSRTVRFVNHLKLAAAVGGAPVAKVYLCHVRAPDVKRRSHARSSPGSIG